MFLWNEHQHTPYIHTLEIIAEFLDYNNWFELEKRLYELIQFQNVFGAFPNEKHYTSLLSLTLNHGSLKPLYEFLQQFSSELSLDKKAILGEEIYINSKIKVSKIMKNDGIKSIINNLKSFILSKSLLGN